MSSPRAQSIALAAEPAVGPHLAGPQSAGPQSVGPQSVGRVFAILDYLVAHREGATLSELALYCDAPKTSLVGLLNALLAHACIVRDVSGRYRVGPRVTGLAQRTVVAIDLKDVARSFLEQLVAATGETVAFGVLAPEGDMVVYVDRVESPHPIRYAVTVGERRELYCTALGKVLLAWLGPAFVDAYLKSHRLQRFTETTITTAARLKAELQRIRQDGLARTLGERFPEANGVAAPVFQAGGTLAGALLIAGPAPRMRRHAAANERAVRRTAAGLTDALGGSAPAG